MLSKANRVTHPSDFRLAVRRGRRYSAPHCVVHIVSNERSSGVRFGFIVSKAVGNAVVRNKVRRRLRAVAAQLLPNVSVNSDIVIRALAGSAQAESTTLLAEIAEGIDRIVVKV
ncbi:ribonuclease P protein component [Salinibacterium sp. PAMC 21357]|uniref:ribonuclease P protein component n=1 Tax=Salinibacterium sp. PAMC 21357 TaxID=1112215 RepID=UPI00028A2558|nr:ribonuclease P protein component [Salinibacterium sp. PAMC 21357]